MAKKATSTDLVVNSKRSEAAKRGAQTRAKNDIVRRASQNITLGAVAHVPGMPAAGALGRGEIGGKEHGNVAAQTAQFAGAAAGMDAELRKEFAKLARMTAKANGGTVWCGDVSVSISGGR